MTALLEKRENPKNALWDFFESSTYSTTIFDDKTQYSRLENYTFTYDTAPGVRYYGYKYYNPELGRWINRDKIEEKGGLNICGFVQNTPVSQPDYLGLLELWTTDTDPSFCQNYKKQLEVRYKNMKKSIQEALKRVKKKCPQQS